MAFKMRSGNKVSFKNMGSSPAKDMKTGSYEHSFESPAKQGLITVWDPKSGITKEEHERREQEGMKRIHEIREDAYNKNKKKRDKKLQEIEEKRQVNEVNERKSPAKQKLNKGGEGQDQDKIFNDKGEHIGDYVNDKPVMKPGFKRPVVKPKRTPKKPEPPKPLEPLEQHEAPERYISLEGEWISNPPKKKKSPAKQKKEKWESYYPLTEEEKNTPTEEELDQEKIDQQIKGTYVETEEDIKRRKEEMKKYAPRRKSPVKAKQK